MTSDYENLCEAFEMAEVLSASEESSLTIDVFTIEDKRLKVVFLFNEDQELETVTAEEIK